MVRVEQAARVPSVVVRVAKAVPAEPVWCLPMERSVRRAEPDLPTRE